MLSSFSREVQQNSSFFTVKDKLSILLSHVVTSKGWKWASLNSQNCPYKSVIFIKLCWFRNQQGWTVYSWKDPDVYFLENFTVHKNNFSRESYGSFSWQRLGCVWCQRDRLEGDIKFRFFGNLHGWKRNLNA
jgi:hypothetical protein